MKIDSGDFVVRPATCADAIAIYRLIREHTDNLIPRSLSDIVQNIDRFVVSATVEGRIIGAAAFAILPEIGDPTRTTIEIQSVCVDSAYRMHGIGRSLVLEQLRRVRPLGASQVIALTFTPPFFERLGFREVPKASLMHKIYMGCINCTKHESPFTCPEVAMALTPAKLSELVGE